MNAVMQTVVFCLRFINEEAREQNTRNAGFIQISLRNSDLYCFQTRRMVLTLTIKNCLLSSLQAVFKQSVNTDCLTKQLKVVDEN